MGRQRIELLFKAQTPKKAADQDYTLAQYRLALIFYFDHKDYAKALYYYKAAAACRSAQGHRADRQRTDAEA
jgi:TPR repeat protein